MSFVKKYLKWFSTFLVLTGILLTNLNMYPINIMFVGYMFKLVRRIPVSTKKVLNHLRYFLTKLIVTKF